VAAHALFPVFQDPVQGKIVFGIVHSLLGLGLVLAGSFKLFEGVMSACVGVMFVLVLVTAVLVGPEWGAVAKGLAIPTIPAYLQDGADQGVGWTFALMGGVGGTLTILSYGYWIREEGREGGGALRLCRLDLMVAYLVTALFGLAVIIIASKSDLERQASAALVVSLSDQLAGVAGTTGRLVFLIGAWAAMFSSLLGVSQSVPYMFADYWRITRLGKRSTDQDPAAYPVDTHGRPYRLAAREILFADAAQVGDGLLGARSLPGHVELEEVLTHAALPGCARCESPVRACLVNAAILAAGNKQESGRKLPGPSEPTVRQPSRWMPVLSRHPTTRVHRCSRRCEFPDSGNARQERDEKSRRALGGARRPDPAGKDPGG
jgi:hypothetical protein